MANAVAPIQVLIGLFVAAWVIFFTVAITVLIVYGLIAGSPLVKIGLVLLIIPAIFLARAHMRKTKLETEKEEKEKSGLE